jgi:hypothetical protein
MKQTEDTTLIDKAMAEAYEIGKRTGANSAEWYAQGTFNRYRNKDKEMAKNILTMLDDCDPKFWVSVELPDLSGQYADGLTPISLYSQLCFDFKIYTDFEEGEDEIEIDHWLVDGFCSQYEMGVSDGFENKIVEICQAHLDVIE